VSLASYISSPEGDGRQTFGGGYIEEDIYFVADIAFQGRKSVSVVKSAISAFLTVRSIRISQKTSSASLWMNKKNGLL
jgi:hypothetical protein